MSYQFYRTITIDATKCGSADSTNFPILFAGTYTYLKTTANSGNVTNSNGYDIVFATDNTGATLYDFELVTYSATTGAVEFWVRIPTLSHTVDTVIYLFYGNSSISTYQGNTNGTWNSNYKGVWHLAGLTDSTSSGFTLTAGNSPTQGTGQIDGDYVFVRASSQYLNNANAPVTTFPLTFSSWVKLANTTFALGEDRAILSVCKKSATDEFSIGWYRNGAGTFTGVRAVSETGGGAWQNFWGVVFDTSWHLVTAVWTNSSTFQFYFDGAAVSQGPLGSPQTPSGVTDVYISGRFFNTSNFYGGMDGDIDEVRIYASTITASWALTEYNNQSSPSTFYAVGAAVPIGGGGGAGGFRHSTIIGNFGVRIS